MRNRIFLIVAVLTFLALQTLANTNTQLAHQALSMNLNESETAVAALRKAGQTGLDELFSVYRTEIDEFQNTGNRNEKWLRISSVIDRVAMQKDAYASQLYWFTDLDEAKLVSKQSGKPILSLRLLGKLNEEFSCANSRFFRSLLYSNKDIAKTMRENYVLHWKSVRPAPRITVDFGDGRKLERTITGNSIHYFLDQDGQILDALPGLYSPQEFKLYLEITLNRYKLTASQPGQNRVFQQIRRSQLLNKWQSELNSIGVKMTDLEKANSEDEAPKAAPTALEAAPRAVTKMAVELPMVTKFVPTDESSLQAVTGLEVWKKLSKSYGNSMFDQNTLSFIRQQTNGNKELTEQRFSEMLKALEDSVALDTVRNEYLFHTKIYKMLSEGLYSDLDKFNEAVYSDVFLTPRTDEWLGLYSPEIYSALDQNGIIK